MNGIMNALNKPQRVVSWICRLAAAAILLQTLFFKFTGAPESVYIFTKVGMEPWGRFISGVVELIASLLLLSSRFTWAGALLALGVMSGAITSHLTILGIAVQGDGGLLFGFALAVFAFSLTALILHRRQIPCISSLFRKNGASASAQL
jgi:putative oxidoreductase